MNIDMNSTMQETMRLMRAGDLHAATLAIQRGLCDAGSTGSETGSARSAARASCIEGRYRVVPDGDSDVSQTPATTVSPTARTGETPEHDARHGLDGEFRDHRFTCDAGSMQYKIFIPAALGAGAPPLIVMLHGCTQSPDDFACGTRMNALAQKHGYVVAYPAQAKSKNASKCWNWFRSGDQQRGRGEPAILAALTAYLVKAHGIDERRVYVAGLSAGGAMAAVLGSSYPDVYAAIGVHSGLPFGVAHDLPSAFAAMKQGARKSTGGAPAARTEPVPAIVFHGDSDMTVDPCNGAAVIEQCVGTAGSMGEAEADAMCATVEHGSVPGGRNYTRTIFVNAAGSTVAEQWLVHGAGHAWFGGDVSGSYTDPAGPDASEHMLRFFSACVRSAID
jgi:poly(hydroxyalkanoate) depolymerase family esterase